MGSSDSNGPRGQTSLWVAVLTAGIAAGVIAWLVGESVYGFVPTPRPTGQMGGMTAADLRKLVRADAQNAILAFGPMGAILGLTLGLAGGFARRSVRSAAVAGIIGFAVGGLVSVCATLGVLIARARLPLVADDNLLLALAIHAGIWLAVGAVGGIALGVGLGGKDRIGRAAIGGVLGAAGATVLYELVGAGAFPMASTHLLISETWATRLLARLLVTTLAAAGAAWSVGAAERPKAADQPLPG